MIVDILGNCYHPSNWGIPKFFKEYFSCVSYARTQENKSKDIKFNDILKNQLHYNYKKDPECLL
jgi:hypothetical protein